MRKNLFDIKIKYDGVSIIDRERVTEEELDQAIFTFKRKFGR